MVYAIDFDGTIVEDKYPEIGEPKRNRIDAILRLQSYGAKIILWTCRTGEQLQEAVKWCADRGLIFDAVNQNLPEVQAKWGGDTRKVFCDMYIDDKNMPDYFLDCV
jgi:hypothetical protein